MKQKNLRFGQIFAALGLVAVGSLLNSCSKEKNVIPSPSYSIATFAGSYVGISSCDTGVVTFTINAGTDRTNVFFPATFGSGQCQLITTIPGTVAGNVVTVDTTNYQDHCFGDYSVWASGTLSNDSLFLTINGVTPLGPTTCSFMGRKVAPAQ
jgi:hypothetical protein